jgi:hypothetical protein
LKVKLEVFLIFKETFRSSGDNLKSGEVQLFFIAFFWCG